MLNIFAKLKQLRLFLLFVFFILTLLPVFLHPINHDAAWWLYVTEGFLNGSELYVDYIDVNFPMIAFLNIPPVVLANAFGWSKILIFKVFVIVLVMMALSLSLLLIKGIVNREVGLVARIILLATAILLLIFPSYGFGQREHFITVLIFPFLFLIMARARKQNPSPILACLIGMLVGIGIGIKPIYLLFWLVLEAYLHFKHKVNVVRWENITMGTVLVVYSVVMVLVTPRFIDVAQITLNVYGAYNNPWAHLILREWTSLLVLGGLLFLATRPLTVFKLEQEVLLFKLFNIF